MSPETTKPISDHSEPPPDLTKLNGAQLPRGSEVSSTEQGIVRPTDVDREHRDTSADRAVAFSDFEHGYLWSNILFAEQKAGFIFAADAAFIGYLTANGILNRIFSTHQGWGIKGFVAVMALACLSLSVASVIRVVMPSVKGSHSGLVFWGAVARLRSGNQYVESVTRLRDSDFAVETLQHCHELAKIVRAKYVGVRLGIILGLLGFIAGLAYTRMP